MGGFKDPKKSRMSCTRFLCKYLSPQSIQQPCVSADPVDPCTQHAHHASTITPAKIICEFCKKC